MVFPALLAYYKTLKDCSNALLYVLLLLLALNKLNYYLIPLKLPRL
jgi:hypothetical protein